MTIGRALPMLQVPFKLTPWHKSVIPLHVRMRHRAASANLLDGQDVYCRVERPEGRADRLGVNLVIVIVVVVLEDVCKSETVSHALSWDSYI